MCEIFEPTVQISRKFRLLRTLQLHFHQLVLLMQLSVWVADLYYYSNFCSSSKSYRLRFAANEALLSHLITKASLCPGYPSNSSLPSQS